MNTKRITTEIAQAADAIRAGQLVAVPTETVYGLAGNGLDPAAVAQIYEIKGRPAVKPLSLMVHDASAMARYCADVPPAAYTLAEAFWPGPLTLVLEAKKDVVPSIVRAGKDTVGLRCPAHPLTLSLLERARLPLAGPSANPSGAPSPTTAQQVLAYFDGQIEGVIDGGECTLSRESTILDLTQKPFKILREGAALPTYGTASSAGADLRACLDAPAVLAPGETRLIPIGIAMEIPEGYVGLVFARSGLASRRDLAPANKVGVVDSDYRGEFFVPMRNHGAQPQTIEPGERIAQFILTPYLTAQFFETETLTDTARGEGGFGSTGAK